jgi:stalled ribosome alternative rescue factor ArfA
MQGQCIAYSSKIRRMGRGRVVGRDRIYMIGKGQGKYPRSNERGGRNRWTTPYDKARHMRIGLAVQYHVR